MPEKSEFKPTVVGPEDVVVRHRVGEPGFRIVIPIEKFKRVEAERLAILRAYCRGRLDFKLVDGQMVGWVANYCIPSANGHRLANAVRACFPGKVTLVREASGKRRANAS